MEYTPIQIPSNKDFCSKFHLWIQKIVNKKYKHNKQRSLDTAQEVRIRILSKDLIGRWFYKHLTDDHLDAAQAEKVLGLNPGAMKYMTVIPVANNLKRNDPNAIWRISDILEFAKFDRDRYFYSIQNHCIKSDMVLKLIGKKDGNYNSLASLFRQNKLIPNDFKNHNCTGDRNSCPECLLIKLNYKKNRISLSHDWEDESVRKIVKNMKWNDSQLHPFLRNWGDSNRVFATPSYIMRPIGSRGIEAGLLKYAHMAIDNAVNNIFKYSINRDDLDSQELRDVGSPLYSNEEQIGWELDDSDNTLKKVYRDVKSLDEYQNFERSSDISSLIQLAELTTEELCTIHYLDMEEMSSLEYSEEEDIPRSRVHRLRASALTKLRLAANMDAEDADC